MSQKIVIDASVFISSFSKEEQFYKDSVALIKKIVTEQIQVFVPMLTIFEILQSLYRKTQDLKKVDRAYQQLIDLNVSQSLTIINLEADFLAYFVTHHHKFPLKTSDAVIALTASREHCPLVSWDKQLLKAASKQIETYTPKEYLKRN